MSLLAATVGVNPMSSRRSLIEHALRRALDDDEFWDILLSRSNAQAGPLDGACLICAKAILVAFGVGELVRITSDLNDGQTEHYGALIDGIIYDFDGGADTAQAWVARVVSNEQITDRRMEFATGIGQPGEIPDDEQATQAVSRLLSQYTNIEEIRHATD